MRATRIQISNFRGVKTADILLPQHGVLIGDNNIGKTTVLGSDRVNQQPPIDKHNFFKDEYKAKAESKAVGK